MVLVTTTLLPASAAASGRKNVFISEFEIVEPDMCGIPNVVSRGRFKFIEGFSPRGRLNLPHYFENAHGFHELTNPANGRWMRQEYNAILKDVRVTRNSDGTLRVISKFTGREVLYSSDGTRLGHTTGTTKLLLRVDDGGTSDPEDDVVISETLLLDVGQRYPEGFCAIVRGALL